MEIRANSNFVRLSCDILKVFFRHTSVSDVLSQNAESDKYKLSEDGRTINEFMRNALEDEIKPANRQQLEEQLEAFFSQFRDKPITIYDVLFYFAYNILYPRFNGYCYRYEYTDIWNSYARFFDEELITASAVMLNEVRRGNRTEFPLSWSYCIHCDNRELISMLNRDNGTSENHFHLRCSSPYFYISWIYLMNHVDNFNYENNIKILDSNRLTKNESSIQKESLVLLWRKAAAIRLFLYVYVSETDHTFQDFDIDREFFEDDVKKFGLTVDLNDNIFSDKFIQVNKLRKYYLSTPDSLSQYKKRCLDGMYQWVNSILDCDNIHIMPINQLQGEIDNCELLQNGQIDYAQVQGQYSGKYYHLQGERYLLTQVLRKIHFKTIGCERAENLLYLYLIIKHQFRVELVQSNERNGFYNFSEFQERKSLFVPRDFEEQLAEYTFSNMIEDVRIHRAELRITPKESAEANAHLIEMYDRAICSAIKKAKQDGQKEVPEFSQFFYTYHFPKIQDNQHYKMQCRNKKCRITARKRADAILALRKTRPEIAQRIYGIDACSAEIRCRPETFGSVFRKLQYYDSSVSTMNSPNTHQLMATYHVGEDNFDIVDSLRAIDEAIQFLDLRSGCRLGHATYLGISPEKYYKSLYSHISIPKQIWLDNSIWMYYFMKEYSITFEGNSLLMHFLEEQFSIFFKEIYQSALTSDSINYILSRVPDGTYSDMPDNYEKCIFNLHHYHLSWFLRGDEPELYQSGYLEKPEFLFEEYKLCSSRSEMESGRDCFEATFLYYLYQFDKKIKLKGDEPVSINIPDYYIKGVEEIQKALRNKIVRMGISIETNPTSNLYISTVQSYAEHPIMAFYNYELTGDCQSEQMNVSINTDDKSVFSTSLSNEYTYLLFYLENKKDEHGKNLYTRAQIMRWLNQIRIMGNEQSFSN